MLKALGYPCHNQTIADIYAGVIDGMIIDQQDQADLLSLAQMGVRAEALPTLMTNAAEKISVMTQIVHTALTWQER